MSDARLPGYVSSAEPMSGAELAAAWLAAHNKGSQAAGYGVQAIVRVADEMGISRETAIADVLSIVDHDEATTRPASLQDIVLLALSHGIIFDSSTQAFLLDLCERLDGEARVDVPARASRLTEELQALARLLNDLVTSGGDIDADAALAAQVWRIEAITTHERALAAITHQAAARATIMRRHSLHYFEDADLRALSFAMTQARDIGEPPGQVSRAAWTAAARGVVAAFWINREERVFMLDQLASYLLEESGLALSPDARILVTAVARGDTEIIAA